MPAFRRPFALALFAALSATAPFVHAATLEWQASSGLTPDQQDPRWQLLHTGLAPSPQVAGGVLSLGTVAPTSDYSFYSVNAADLLAPSGSAWLEAEVRLVQGGGTVGWWRAPVALVISFANGNTAILELGADEAWLRNGNNSVGAALTGIDTDSSLHQWRLEASGDATGSWVAAYRDGVQVLGANAVHASAGATLGVAWGDASILAWGSSEWASVRTNMAAVSSVPEPGLWGLWLAGLAGLGATRRRAHSQK